MLKTVIFVFLWTLIGACSDAADPVDVKQPVLQLDEIAPDFIFTSLTDPDAGTIKLSDYRGKVVYLDFWASWCKPCLKSMPLINGVRKHLVGHGFEVIAVNLDDVPEKGREFLTEYPVDFPVVRTANENIFELYQLNGLPISYLIDRDGILKHVHRGFNEKDIKGIKKRIISLLN